MAQIDPDGPEDLAPRAELSERQLKEFRKTASLVEAPPFKLANAASYVRQLCDRNQIGHHMSWEPPDIDWVRTEQPHIGEGQVGGFASDELGFARHIPQILEMHGGKLQRPTHMPEGRRKVPTGSGAPARELDAAAPEGATVLRVKPP